MLKCTVRVQLPEVSPDSSSAFNILVDFCISEGITKECTAGTLAIVLTLPGHTISTIKLPPLVTPLNSNSARGEKDHYYDKLLECLNSCISLSCSRNGINSLLCSVFFDPKVPCNLVGAHLLGVTKAIEPVKRNQRAFANLMVRRCPKISPLWLAAIWSGQASRILVCSMGALPPISLPVASWTETLQSFLQIGYYSI